MTLHRALLGVYGGLWRAAEPLLRRHKRLRQGFDQRLVPDDWLPADWQAVNWQAEAEALGLGQGHVPGQVPDHVPCRVPDQPQDALPGKPARIWVQAASGGESRLLHSLLPALVAAPDALAHRPQYTGALRILCTTCTRQGMDILERLPSCASPGDSSSEPGGFPRLQSLCRYFPLDRPDLMRKALRLFRPDLIVLLETELWPSLLYAAKEAGVPVIVLNGRMTPGSFKAYSLTPAFWKSLAPTAVLAISDEDAQRFSSLFGLTAGVMPNIKFDLTAADLTQGREQGDPASAPGQPSLPGPPPMPGQPDPAARRLLSEHRLLVSLASVREEEEPELLHLAEKLLGRDSAACPDLDRPYPLTLAIAPRHMHRVPAWQKALQGSGVPVFLRSEQRAGTPRPETAGPQILLWDSFGELSTLYAVSDAVFVGGSLAPLGGQNFLEPLAQGLAPIVGPYLDNFSWAGTDLFALGLARRVHSAEELGEALCGELRQRARLLTAHAHEGGPALARALAAESVRRKFGAWLGSHTGGAAQAAALALSYLSR